jgi:inorganic pyrophosphatase
MIGSMIGSLIGSIIGSGTGSMLGTLIGSIVSSGVGPIIGSGCKMNKAVIEMPAGTKLKIEKDKATGLFLVDRQLPIECPANYGFIEGTTAPDGDADDIFMLGDRLATGTEVEEYEVLGVYVCMDQGVRDDKLVAVPGGLRGYDSWKDIIAVGSYLSKYKEGFQVIRWVEGPVDFGD